MLGVAKLGFEMRHIDVGRTFGRAGLAGKAGVEDLVRDRQGRRLDLLGERVTDPAGMRPEQVELELVELIDFDNPDPAQRPRSSTVAAPAFAKIAEAAACYLCLPPTEAIAAGGTA